MVLHNAELPVINFSNLFQAVVDIGPQERSPGLSYVALSRVKSLAGLLLHPFSFKRVKGFSSSKPVKERLKWEETLLLKQY